MLFLLPFLFYLSPSSSLRAQSHIVAMRPDAAAAGMTLAVEVLAATNDASIFGTDGLNAANVQVYFTDTRDSLRAVIGPHITSWNGRVLQFSLLVAPSATLGPLPIGVRVNNVTVGVDTLHIVLPRKLTLDAGTVLGENNNGTLTKYNTMVVDGLELSVGPGQLSPYTFSLTDPDTLALGNPRYQPVTLLSVGPINLNSATLRVGADTIDGGPGGGGGGHGYAGFGGKGFTGGGSDSDDVVQPNLGSGGDATATRGGASITGVPGGGSEINEDQGGGGGTGNPYGSSGAPGASGTFSAQGGFGGASAGGERENDTAYGGGGGGYGASGTQGEGIGDNGGKQNGGRFLVPLMGGSGGGAGNSLQFHKAGSGGGGGGGLSLVSFSTLRIRSGAVDASGASGTDGTQLAAAGGGGSGGGILIAAREGIEYEHADLLALGGKGGNGGIKGGDGGVGSLGRVRIDGPMGDSCIMCATTAIFSGGVALDIPKQALIGRNAEIHGTSNDANNLTDVIRIFYRSEHSQWRFVDTVRYFDGKHYLWKKTLDLPPDSLIYVTVMEQVASPRSSFADFEPAWIISHISSGIVTHVPQPVLAMQSDTLNFECTKIGRCLTKRFVIFDSGEAPLRIDSFAIDPPQPFAVLSTHPRTIAGYHSDTLEIQYCPNVVGAQSAKLSIFSNDIVRNVMLNGCGIKRSDSLVIRPKPIAFGRVPDGTCDTITLTLLAVGVDPSVITVEDQQLAPFTVLGSQRSFTIPVGDSIKLLVEYCPIVMANDKGYLIIDGDTVRVSGTGTRKLLTVRDSIDLGDVCLSQPITFRDTLRLAGNDTVLVSSASARVVVLDSPAFPERIGDSLITHWTVRLSTTGAFRDTIQYASDAEGIIRTIIFGTTSRLDAELIDSLDLGTICAANGGSDTVTLFNRTSDPFTITSAKVLGTTAFSVPQLASGVAGLDSLKIPINLSPTPVGTIRDTLELVLTSGGCDTTLRLALVAVSTAEQFVLSSTKIDFDSVSIDSCKLDSIVIANPCGPPITIDPKQVSAPFELVRPLVISDIPSGGALSVVYRYCPLKVGSDNAQVLIQFGTGESRTIALSGFGKAPSIEKGSVNVIVTDTFARSGEHASTRIVLDSIGGKPDIHNVSLIVTYDPTVIFPLSITPDAPGWIMGRATGSTPGKLLINASGSSLTHGVLGRVEWLALKSPKDATAIVPQVNSIAADATLVTTPGFFVVTDCGGNKQSFTIAGHYSVSMPYPNPTTGEINFTMQLGTEGPVTAKIFNVLGELKLELLSGQILSSGSHDMKVDVSGLPNGSYILRVESLGWTVSHMFTKR